MSDQTTNEATPNQTTPAPADVLPGYELSPFDLMMLGQVEQELELQYTQKVTFAMATAPEEFRDQGIRAVCDDLIFKRLAYGRPAFDAQVRSLENLPFLLWVSLRQKHKKITRQEVRALITPANEATLYKTVMELLGIRWPSTAPAAA